MTGSYASGGDPLDRMAHALAASVKAMAQSGRHHHGGSRRRGPRGDFRFGPGFPFSGPPFGHGRKARRGDVRAAALVLLDEEPRNGYQLMQEIEERSDGAWRPSPGSVYPALQQLEDEGLVRAGDSEGRRLFELTDAGRAYVEEHRADLGAPWEAFSRDLGDDMKQLGTLIKDVAIAAAQVMRAGDESQLQRAQKVLANTRRELYLVLADGREEVEDED
jgi:DNA-binding PadR family transcriptional regulator